MHNLRVLLAEDMPHERLAIMASLRAALPPNVTADFTQVDFAEGAVKLAKETPFDLVILDLDFSKSERSGGMKGLDASVKIRQSSPEAYIVVVSSTEEEETMARAVEECGVDWYLRRSAISYDELAWLARQALLARLHREGTLVDTKYHFITETPQAKQVLRQVDAILPGQNTLIYGETGTGKELIARRIHANAAAFDPRRRLVVLDCSSLSPQLFESEVFGHKKGSFTGATHDRPGALELVNGGDLFLDEIHNIPPFLQQKLLRVLNDGVFSPVGSNQELRSRFRIIAATNVPLNESAAKGNLLPDFVARIRKIKVDLPPLRDRQADIPPLVESHMKSMGSFDKEFSKEAIAFMQTLPWKDNIRGLKGFIDTMVASVKIPIISRSHVERQLSAGDQTNPAPLPQSSESSVATAAEESLSQGLKAEEAMKRFLAAYLVKAAEKHEGADELAKATGFSRATLYRQMKELGVLAGVKGKE